MIRVNLGNRTLGITFQREYEKVEIEKSNGDGSVTLTAQGFPRATFCEIHNVAQFEREIEGEKRLIWESVSIVARTRALIATKGKVKDNFSAEKGRKIALARALKQYGLSRDGRLLVWNAYFDRPRVQSHLLTQAPAEPVHLSDATGHVDPPRNQVHATLHSLDLHAGEM